MTTTWDPTADGVLALPSGRLVRGRALRRRLPAGPAPHLTLALLEEPPEPCPWETRWLPWPDFGLPLDPERALVELRTVWERAPGERVEVACRGGRGRTGTALACLAVLDGVPPAQAVRLVRRGYSRLAVETRAQARWVGSWAGPPTPRRAAPHDGPPDQGMPGGGPSGLPS